MEHALGDQTSAMAVDLNRVFAGIGARIFHHDEQDIIDDFILFDDPAKMECMALIRADLSGIDLLSNL